MATVDNVLVPRRTFVVRAGGRSTLFLKGQTTIAAGHPMLAGREHLFKPLTVEHDIDLRPRPTATPPSRSPSAAKPSAPAKPDKAKPEKPEKPATPTGLAAFAAIKARAKELGLPTRGTKAELEAAVAAEEQRQAGGKGDDKGGDDETSPAGGTGSSSSAE